VRTRAQPRDRVVEAVVRLDRQQRPEDLLAHDRHRLVHADHQRRSHLPRVRARTVQELDDARAAALRILEQPAQACMMAVAHDRRVIRRARRGRIQALRRRPDGGHESVEVRARHERVVGRDARLPRVEELACHEARREARDVRALVEHGGRLAAELERHRREVARSGLRHAPPHCSRPGEEQVIERQSAECLADGCVALDHGELVCGEALRDARGQQCGRGRRELARLEQHAVAGRKRGDDRCERELHGIVPRTDDAHRSARLPHDPRPARPQPQRRRDPQRAHPARDVTARVPRLGCYDVELGEARLVRGAVAEIAVDRRDPCSLVVENADETRQPITPHGGRRPRIARECGTLPRKERVQIDGASMLRARLCALGCHAAILRRSLHASSTRNTAAVPPTISAAPPIMPGVIASSRNHAPHSMPSAGMRNVTVRARVGPMSRMRRK
jgi:hypothetical protein